MKIVSTFDRKPGEVIDMNTQVYEFARDAQGRYVLEVNDPAHCARLLSLPEAFALHPDEVDAPEPVVEDEVPVEVEATPGPVVAEAPASEVAAPVRRARRAAE
jgi:hypothetical protein